MDLEGTLLSFGYRRDEVRTDAAALVFAILTITVVGTLLPTSIERTDLLDPGDTGGQLAVVVTMLALLAGSTVAGYVIAARFIQHRWAWPIGPRVPGPARTGLNWPAVFATGVVLFGRRLLPDDATPSLASGTYPIPGTGTDVIRVRAPVDLAFVLVLALLAWVFAFALAIIAATAWRSMSKTRSVT